MAGGSIIGDILEKFGQKMKAELQQAIEDKKVVASRVLKQSIFFETKILGQKYHFKLGFLPPADEYAPAVDTGSKPHFPPIQPLIEWIGRKPELIAIARQMISKKRGRTLTGLKNKKVKKGLKQLTEAGARRSLAFAIAVNMRKKGTLKRFGYGGSGFWTETVTDGEINTLKAALSKAMGREVILAIDQIKREVKGN